MAKDEEADMGRLVDFKVTAENYREISDSDVDGAFTIIAQDHDSVSADNLIRFFRVCSQLLKPDESASQTNE